MTADDLYTMNPWWIDGKSIYNDKDILEYEGNVFKFHPKYLFNEISLEKAGIYTLRGPRQIGKTTFLKLLIRDLLEKGTNPLDILFITCDGLRDRFELIEVLKMYNSMFGKRENLKYIMIDEISVLSDWQLSVKYMVDVGILHGDVVILTGSSAYDLRRSSERMPGRKGYGKDLVYLPLTFRDYLESIGHRGIEVLDAHELLSLGDDEIKSLKLRYSFLKAEYERYMAFGGFPRAINDFLTYGKIGELTVQVYKDFVLGDAEKYMGSRTRVRELLAKLPGIIGQRYSWHSLIDVFSGKIESVDTIRKYFEYLGYSYIVFNLFFIDISKKTVRIKKQKKTYPLDKIVAEVIKDVSKEEIQISHLMEMYILRHLLRMEDVLDFGLNLYTGPYFWYSERGNEIDFVYDLNGTLIPIEVKYQRKVSRFDYLRMERVFGRGIIITKDAAFKDGNIVGIPAWLFSAVFKS